MARETHTPTPWRLVGSSGDLVIRGPRGADGYRPLVAVLRGTGRSETDTTAAANGRLIVAAVNERAALRDALGKAQGFCARIGAGTGMYVPRANELHAKLCAALALDEEMEP